MFESYLKEGDIVYLKSGMTVGVEGVRAALTNDDISPFCPFVGLTHVKIGKDYQTRTDVSKERERIRKIIQQAFADDFIPLDEPILDRFLANQIRKPEKLALYIHPTRYVVTRVEIQGKIRTVYCKEIYSYDGRTVYFHQGPSEVRGPLVHNWVQRV